MVVGNFAISCCMISEEIDLNIFNLQKNIRLQTYAYTRFS